MFGACGDLAPPLRRVDRRRFPPQAHFWQPLGFLKDDKPMQSNRIISMHPDSARFSFYLLLACMISQLASHAAPLQITDSHLQDGAIALAWTGNAYNYEVQTTGNLADPHWTTVLATVRTNAILPLAGNASYYRLQDASASPGSLTLNMTNLTTGDELTISLEPQTNTDMVFDLPSGANGVDLTQLVFAGSELQEFDVAFPAPGEFTIVTNGTPTSWVGAWTSSPGSGTNEITYQGYLTDGTDMVMFSADTDPEPIEVVIGGIVGTINWWRCSPQFVGPWLQCAQDCTTQALTCALQLKSSYCRFVTHVTAKFDGSIDCGTCECQHGCN